MVSTLALAGLLIRSPLLIAAVANVKKVQRENKTAAALRRFARKTGVSLNGSSAPEMLEEEEITSEVYVSGLGSVFSGWLVSTLVVCPLLLLLVLLGDAYVLPCVALVACLLLPPVQFLGAMGDTRIVLPSKSDPFGKYSTQ